MAAAKPATQPSPIVNRPPPAAEDQVMIETIDKLLNQGVDPAIVQQVATMAMMKRAGPVQLPGAITTPTQTHPPGGFVPPEKAWWENDNLLAPWAQDLVRQAQATPGGPSDPARIAELAPEIAEYDAANAPSQTHPNPGGGRSWIDDLLAGMQGGAPPPFGPVPEGSPPRGPMGMPMPGGGPPLPTQKPEPPAKVPYTGSSYPIMQPKPAAPAAAPAPAPTAANQPGQAPGGPTVQETAAMTQEQQQSNFKDWDWEDLLSFGLRMMAESEPQPGQIQGPSLLGALGRAGAGTLAEKRAQRAGGVAQRQKQQEIDIAGHKVLLDAETNRLLYEMNDRDKQIQRSIQAANLNVDAQQAITQIYKQRDEQLGNALAQAAVNAPEGVDVEAYKQQIIQDINRNAEAQIQMILQSTAPFLPNRGGPALQGSATPQPGSTTGVNRSATPGSPSFAIDQRTGRVTAIRTADGRVLVPNNR